MLHLPHEGAMSDLLPLMHIALFCACLLGAGLVCRRVRDPSRSASPQSTVLLTPGAQLGVDPLIGEMIVGVALGPSGADIVPFPQFFRLVGAIGVRAQISTRQRRGRPCAVVRRPR